MPALDTLHFKAELLGDLDSMFWRQYVHYFLESGAGHHGYSAGDEWIVGPATPDSEEAFKHNHVTKVVKTIEDPRYTSTRHDVNEAQYTARMRRTIQMSEAYYVSPEMHVLASAAATTLPDDTIVEAHHLPSPSGFMLIPGNGVVMLDVRGKKCATNVIVWDTYGGAVHLTYLIDKYNSIDAHNTKIHNLDPSRFEIMPRLTPWSFGEIGLGKPLPQYLGLGELPPELSDVLNIVWESDKVTYSVADEHKHLTEGLKLEPFMQVEPTVKWFVATVMLMGQTLVSLTEVPVDRAMRRRLQRINLDARATVIELRKHEGRPFSESTFEYSHRFLRRGHWRNQAYKEVKGGEWLHRPVWIHPTVVGPKDKPLVVREHVNALVR